MNKKITVCLNGLYDKFNGNLFGGTIEKTVEDENEYFDLYTNEGLVCMDGETCIVIEEKDGMFILKNENGECDTTFILTKEEMQFCR